MSTTFLDSLNIVLSLLGSLALIILALRLLANAQTKLTLGSKLRVRRANGMQFSPLSAAISGFINAATTGNTLRTTSTLFSAIHAKMMCKKSAAYMLLGISQSHIILVALAWIIVWLAPPLMFAIALAGVGLLLSPLLKSEETKAVPRMIISLALLIIGLNYFIMIASQCLISLTIDHVFVQEFLSYGTYAIILGALVGVLFTIAIKNIDAALLAILALSTAPLAPVNLLFGAMIGTSLGGIFLLTPLAESEGTVAKKIIARHAILIITSIIISALVMPFVVNGMLYLGADKVVLPIAYLLHLSVILWLGMVISKPIADKMDKKVPDRELREMRLKVLSSRIRPDSTISLILAHNETINHIRRTYKMMSFIRDMLSSDGDEEYVKEMNVRVDKYNKITERVEAEVLSYVCAIALDNLSRINTEQMQRVIVSMNTVAQIAGEVCDLSELVLQGIIGENPLDDNQKYVLRNVILELQTLTYKAIELKSKKPSDVKLQAFAEELQKLDKEIKTLSAAELMSNNKVLMIEAMWQTKKINGLIAKLVPQSKDYKTN